MKFEEIIKRYKWIIFGVIILLLLAGTFYWFAWRPSNIRKNCYKEAKIIEAKINALNGYIPFGKSVTEDIGNCYEETILKIRNCYGFGYISITAQMEQKNKDCRTKVETEAYNTCYKRCLQGKGL